MACLGVAAVAGDVGVPGGGGQAPVVRDVVVRLGHVAALAAVVHVRVGHVVALIRRGGAGEREFSKCQGKGDDSVVGKRVTWEKTSQETSCCTERGSATVSRPARIASDSTWATAEKAQQEAQ